MSADDFALDFCGLPEYTVNHTVTENAGDGHVRIYHWTKKGKFLDPQFTVVITARELATISASVRETALEVLAEQTIHGCLAS